MFPGTHARFAFAFAVIACAWLAAGCVHPLGPGYHFPDRQAEIRVATASPGRIQIRVTDELINAGDRPLHSIDVRLPEGRAFGEQNLRMTIGGTEVSPQSSSPIDPRMMRAPFSPVWKENETRKVVTEWELMPQFSPRGTIVASPEGFFIADETALPLWQTPLGVFPRGGTIPGQQLLTVVAPSDFRVLASGKQLKTKAEGNEIVRRYLSLPGNEFRTYIVAGRYQETIVRTREGQVQFWTFHSLDPAASQAAAARLSSSMSSFADFFGRLAMGRITVRVAESPVDLPGEFLASSDPGGASFPEGVLLDPRDFQQGLASEQVVELSEYELARTWYGWRVRPRPEAQILMGRSVGLFGLVVAAEGRANEQRAGAVASLIHHYDEARASAPDKRLMGPPEGYSRGERISTGYRGALFFVALEDLCGHDSLKTALRDVLEARADSDAGYEELLAALETASHKDLAEMFRKWLIQPGVPDEFRARYAHPSTMNAAR